MNAKLNEEITTAARRSARLWEDVRQAHSIAIHSGDRVTELYLNQCLADSVDLSRKLNALAEAAKCEVES